MNTIDSRKRRTIDFYRAHKRMPSYSELCGLLGFSSKQASVRVVDKWVDEKFLSKDEKGKLIPGDSFHALKLLGLIEAGFPTGADESTLDTISLDEFLIPQKDASYMLRVKGDSMIDAGICEGDYVIVERTANPKIGEIVIAEIDGGFTMKYLRKEKDRYFLEPANRKYKNIFPEEDMKVVAVVRSVIRKY